MRKLKSSPAACTRTVALLERVAGLLHLTDWLHLQQCRGPIGGWSSTTGSESPFGRFLFPHTHQKAEIRSSSTHHLIVAKNVVLGQD